MRKCAGGRKGEFSRGADLGLKCGLESSVEQGGRDQGRANREQGAHAKTGRQKEAILSGYMPAARRGKRLSRGKRIAAESAAILKRGGHKDGHNGQLSGGFSIPFGCANVSFLVDAVGIEPTTGRLRVARARIAQLYHLLLYLPIIRCLQCSCGRINTLDSHGSPVALPTKVPTGQQETIGSGEVPSRKSIEERDRPGVLSNLV